MGNKNTRHKEVTDEEIKAFDIIYQLPNPKLKQISVPLYPEWIASLLIGLTDDTIPIPYFLLTRYETRIKFDNIALCYNPLTRSVFVNGKWFKFSPNTCFSNNQIGKIIPPDFYSD